MNREVMEKTLPFWGYKGSQKVLRNGQKMTPKNSKNNQKFVLRIKKHEILIIFEILCKFILFFAFLNISVFIVGICVQHINKIHKHSINLHNFVFFNIMFTFFNGF